MSNRIILTVTAASAVALVVAVESWNQPETETARTSAISAPLADPLPVDKPAIRSSDALSGAILLKGVDVIDGITLHPNGELQYSLQLRHLFDHFLGMAGAPERIAAAREGLNQHLRSEATNPGSQEEALHAFDL